ncbi:putative immunity protein [Larkinella insperata]|uniref:Immunity protein n=1 Tax=Larkinella insperata TaxID=332158 RepID=A0ABW3Q720_9BACT
MILPRERDPRFITIRRGGKLTDSDHHLLALWAAACAEHVLPLFEQVNPDDKRPRRAIELTRAWVNGEITMKQAHQTAFSANAAAKGMPDFARFAALAAGQAVAVAHVAAHQLGAAAYAIRAIKDSVTDPEKEKAGQMECQWQRSQLPEAIRELVLEDQQLRNHLCWNIFYC